MSIFKTTYQDPPLELEENIKTRFCRRKHCFFIHLPKCVVRTQFEANKFGLMDKINFAGMLRNNKIQRKQWLWSQKCNRNNKFFVPKLHIIKATQDRRMKFSRERYEVPGSIKFTRSLINTILQILEAREKILLLPYFSKIKY